MVGDEDHPALLDRRGRLWGDRLRRLPAGAPRLSPSNHIPRPPLAPGPFLVVGLARSGIAATRALLARGERVRVHDSGAPGNGELDAAANELRAAGAEIHLGEPRDELLDGMRTVVKSPGVPQDAAVIRAARAASRPVMGELELAWRLVPNAFIAVTGTNGKTTTTEWIGHIFRTAARAVTVVGNVGTAASSLAAGIDPATAVVCEASSFQLEDTLAFAPDAAVLLNLAPDHLDRHGSFEAYVAAKLRIFAGQGNDDVAVAPLGLGIDDLGGCARRVCFGAGAGAELGEAAGQLWWDERPLMASDAISLPGAHNRANAMAAAATCLALGLEAEAVAEGLRSFAGVAHRLETLAVKRGVTYVNDSKATNVDSTLVALRSFPSGVHLIVGGRGKGQDFNGLAGLVAERCRAVYLIGEAAPELAAALATTGVALLRAGELGTAVAMASRAARSGEVVLLSPACASFDQYADFEARGEHFRRRVLAPG